jgi:hypothetical protein
MPTLAADEGRQVLRRHPRLALGYQPAGAGEDLGGGVVVEVGDQGEEFIRFCWVVQGRRALELVWDAPG